MTDSEVAAIVERACTSKPRYSLTQAVARVEVRRHRGELVSKYHCPFGCGHWHVGHVPSVTSMATIAAAIRHRQAGPPVEHEVGS